MVHKALDKERIIRNLSDAGCTEAEVGQMMAAIESHDYKTLDILIEAHRKQLLAQYRSSKQCIDCIDYFTYQFKKSLGGDL